MSVLELEVVAVMEDYVSVEQAVITEIAVTAETITEITATVAL